MVATAHATSAGGTTSATPATTATGTTPSLRAALYEQARRQPNPGRDWNEEFQKLLEGSFADPENELLRTRELRRLCEEFSLLAKRIGTVILSELFLPHHKKTIPPVTSEIGGVAGGEKVGRAFSPLLFLPVLLFTFTLSHSLSTSWRYTDTNSTSILQKDCSSRQHWTSTACMEGTNTL
jgi:hypothetical protein